MTNAAIRNPITPIPGHAISDTDDLYGSEGYDLPLDEQPAGPTTEPVDGSGENYIILVTVNIDCPFVKEGKWKDGMNIAIGRADPLDNRGYFISLKANEKTWNSELGDNDGFAAMTGLHEIGEMMSAMAQKNIAETLLDQLMHDMGNMPLSEFLTRFAKKSDE